MNNIKVNDLDKKITNYILYQFGSDEKDPNYAEHQAIKNRMKSYFDDQILQVLKPNFMPVSDERITDMKSLIAILQRPDTPVAAVLGEAGVGKTTLLEMLSAISLKEEREVMWANIPTYAVIQFDLGKLAYRTDATKILAQAPKDLEEINKYLPLAFATKKGDKLVRSNIKLVIFIDEMHLIISSIGQGTKLGGDVMKQILARTTLPIVGASTRREFDIYVAQDLPLSERFKILELNEMKQETIEGILGNWWKYKLENVYFKSVPALPLDIIRKVMKYNWLYRPQSAEPRKSLDIAADLASKMITTKRMVTLDDVDEIFERRFGLSLHYDGNKIISELDRRIKGQDIAKSTLKKAITNIDITNRRSQTKPRLTLLLSGPTGVGKTESVKALAQGFNPGSKETFKTFNMPDFSSADSEEAFRYRLGQILSHNPSAIILLDEFEKAHPRLINTMLPILDEGLVTYESTTQDGNKEPRVVSLRNAIIIATTNSGAEVFANQAQNADNSYINTQDKSKEAVDRRKRNQKSRTLHILQDLREALLAGAYTPEMLNRFDRIIPFDALKNDALVQISQSQVDETLKLIEATHGISLHLKYGIKTWQAYNLDNTIDLSRAQKKNFFNVPASDIAAFTVLAKVSEKNTNAGGARGAKRETEQFILDEFAEFALEHEIRKGDSYSICLSKNTSLYQPGHDQTEGYLVFEKIN